jgi:nitroimidazol reductase NimA-like FMN-containing flavoprotein (pyridoxamine 5'-phosphate oxidase superfamily)
MVSDLNKSQMLALLHSATIGHLGCYADGRVYVTPICFVYHEGSIYAHSGLGMKTEMMSENPEVCFEVEQVKDIANWQSVITWGMYKPLQGEEADRALGRLVDKLASTLPSGEDDGPHDGPDGASTRHILTRSSRHGVVFRIEITEMTGRSEKR